MELFFDHEYCAGPKFIFNPVKPNDGFLLQIVGLCQTLNDVLDSMSKKGIPVPVWLGLLSSFAYDIHYYIFNCYMFMELFDIMCSRDNYAFYFVICDCGSMWFKCWIVLFRWFLQWFCNSIVSQVEFNIK